MTVAYKENIYTMPRREYISMPDKYPVCLHDECPKAATCLHQIAYHELSAKQKYLWLISPKCATATDDCAYYRDNTPIRYARGFTNFQEKMYPAQYDKFKDMLIARFGRNGYFQRRRGTFAVSPHEQSVVMDALRKAGVATEMMFDSYEERTNWYD